MTYTDDFKLGYETAKRCDREVYHTCEEMLDYEFSILSHCVNEREWNNGANHYLAGKKL